MAWKATSGSRFSLEIQGKHFWVDSNHTIWPDPTGDAAIEQYLGALPEQYAQVEAAAPAAAPQEAPVPAAEAHVAPPVAEPTDE